MSLRQSDWDKTLYELKQKYLTSVYFPDSVVATPCATRTISYIIPKGPGAPHGARKMHFTYENYTIDTRELTDGKLFPFPSQPALPKIIEKKVVY